MTITGPSAPAPADPHAGDTELGAIRISDTVVEKIAAQAVVEIPDAGAAAPRILGRSMDGASTLGARQTSLSDLPKVKADVDGSFVTLEMSISVRWPASVPGVSSAVREHLRTRVSELTGLTVGEVSIVVTDLVTDVPAGPRAR